MPTNSRILVAVKDPWARALPAVDKAAQLARALGARVQLFHALSDPLYVDVAESHGRSLMGLEQVELARVAGRLALLARRIERAGVRADSAATWDFPAHEAVIRAARRFEADLIVAERHSTSHHLPWLLRFTDFELLRLAPVPVLLVKSGQPYRRPRILAAIDPAHAYSKPPRLDREILHNASSVARALHGSLHAIHAFDPLPVDTMAAEVPLGEAARVIETVTEARARSAFDRMLDGSGISRSRRYLVPRHPIDAIEAVARDIGSDIVVVGAVSRSGLKRLVLGNTAERVLDHLPCDVLVVKPKRFVSGVPRARRGPRLVALSAPLAGI
ncbi:MAG: universal stress protein [Steroidobacteraceae bacterium]